MKRRQRLPFSFLRGNIPIVTVLPIALLFSLSTIPHRWYPPSSKSERSKPTLSKIFKSTFCHSNENITIRTYSRHHLRRTCYGNLSKLPSTRVNHLYAFEAPRLSALCTSNPYHGFYDCIWPLVHYVSSCMTDMDKWSRYVVSDNMEVPEKRQKSWVAQAQRIFLSPMHPPARTLYSAEIPNSTAVCFGRVVRFESNTLLRPLRFNMQLTGRNNFSVPHPEPLKSHGLNLFRDVILGHYARSADSVVPGRTQARVLVYDRMRDSRRRKWQNAGDFVDMLRAEVGPRVEFVHLNGIRREFQEQVALFNDATVFLAPHGAAMVNSLFMRKNSVVVEIASRECVPKNDTTEVVFNEFAMKADPNTWTVWHAGYLDILLSHAPSVLTEGGNGDFETNNESLVKLIRMLMDAQTVASSWRKT